MKRVRKSVPHVSPDRWLVSYADFITLLFAFFVVLYAAAEIDKKKAGQVSASVQAAFRHLGALPTPSETVPHPAPNAPHPEVPVKTENSDDLNHLQRELQDALSAEIARGEVVVRPGPEGLVVSLREIGFFESGSAGVAAHSRPAFQRLAAVLAERKFPVRIEGHTDNIPIHNSQFSSNWELSTARATEMVRLLITDYQIPPTQLSAAGYAEYHPAASNDTPDGRAQNRRVDVVILGKSLAEATPDGQGNR